MNKTAFVDTTIITNILLKSGDIHKQSSKALSRFEKTFLPVYAIKEFKAGPLRNFVYVHNKLINTKSYPKTLQAIQRLSLTPQRYKTATALEALMEASKSFSENTPSDLAKKYGQKDMGSILFDETRLSLKTIILIAWKRRRKLTTDIVNPLFCYREVAPTEKRGLILDKPVSCSPDSKCSIKELLKDKLNDVKAVRDAIDPDSTKKEDLNRRRVLKSIYRTPKRELRENDCRYLGDAVFSILAPKDTIILTTNIKDHKPLAKALGKDAIHPVDL